MKENYLLILFYSLSGSVKNLAHAIADGAEQESIKVKIRTVPKVSANTEIIDNPVNRSNVRIIFYVLHYIIGSTFHAYI